MSLDKNILLPTITKEEFWQKLQKRKFEETEVIKMIESFFLQKRGYIFKMPKPGDKVILLISGGLDSTIAWYLLMNHYRLSVYPLFISKIYNKYEKEAIIFFSDYFQNLCPHYFHSPFIASQDYLPQEMREALKPKNLNPNFLLDIFFSKKYHNVYPISGLNSLSPITALHYSKYLLIKRNIRINTIFCAVTAGDGTIIKSQTFTFLRTTMLFLSLFYGDTKLQFASLFLENELNHFLEKHQIIKAVAKFSLPLEKTSTCCRYGRYHCGECLVCYSRKLEFKKAKVPDKTIYENQIYRTKLKLKLNSLLTKLKNIVYI